MRFLASPRRHERSRKLQFMRQATGMSHPHAPGRLKVHLLNPNNRTIRLKSSRARCVSR
jgi:hypothetical protein